MAILKEGTTIGGNKAISAGNQNLTDTEKTNARNNINAAEYGKIPINPTNTTNLNFWAQFS